MANVNKNVIVGAADVYISKASSEHKAWKDEGVELPTFTPNQKAKVKFEGTTAVPNPDWKSAGYTTDGVEVSYEPDFGEVTADQALDSVKMFKQAMRVSVNTTLLEATLENLLFAWGQIGEQTPASLIDPSRNTLTGAADADQTATIAAGQLGDDPVERSVAFIGQAPKGVSGVNQVKRERVYHLRRALQVETSTFSLSRTDATTFPVSFRCLPVSNAVSGDEYGKIYQRVIT